MNIDLSAFSKNCNCGKEHPMSTKEIIIESGACTHLEHLLTPYSSPVFICDGNTYAATRQSLASFYEAYPRICLTGANIHATEIYLAQIKDKLPAIPDILIAVGSGTIHDLTRQTAFELTIPFISMPTAASVDGFTSTVSALTLYGMKTTLPAAAPLYVLADTDIFSKAPYRLTASGISDLMGKYTALTDWKVSHLVTGEYFCQQIYDLQMEVLLEVENILDKIQAKDPDSMEKLMYALILSGLAMQMIGNSRPASGAEHHVSHFWEMEILNDTVDAYHGEKVSVGLVLCTQVYEQILQAIANDTCEVVDQRDLETELIQNTFGQKGLYEPTLKENTPNPLEEVSTERLTQALPSIMTELKKLPGADILTQKLKQAGCLTGMAELNLPASLTDVTLQCCPYVRNRLTLLRLSKMLRF